jgi:hypothetical protein
MSIPRVAMSGMIWGARSLGRWCPWSPRNNTVSGFEGASAAVETLGVVEYSKSAANGAQARHLFRIMEVIPAVSGV